MRQARGARSLLRRVRAARQKREANNPVTDQAAWIEHCEPPRERISGAPRWPFPGMAEDRVEPEGSHDGGGRWSLMAYKHAHGRALPTFTTASPGPDPGSHGFTRPLRHCLITRAPRRRHVGRPDTTGTG
jgi:hypothetical protein